MVDKSLARTVAKLGARMVHSAPYRPQGRGKIERFFNTVTSQFLTEITTLAEEDGQAAVPVNAGGQAVPGSLVTSIQELNSLFTAWVNMVYHHAVHSGTGHAPIVRWEASWTHREPVRKSLDEIREAFCWADTRKVSRSGTVSLHSNTYEVDPALAGTRVELVYDPFDLASGITVTSHLGVPSGEAKPLVIGRHVHAKAVNAARDADGSEQLGSGINYLGLLAHAHQQSLTAAPISFATLASGQDSSTEVVNG